MMGTGELLLRRRGRQGAEGRQGKGELLLKGRGRQGAGGS